MRCRPRLGQSCRRRMCTCCSSTRMRCCRHGRSASVELDAAVCMMRCYWVALRQLVAAAPAPMAVCQWSCRVVVVQGTRFNTEISAEAEHPAGGAGRACRGGGQRRGCRGAGAQARPAQAPARCASGAGRTRRAACARGKVLHVPALHGSDCGSLGPPALPINRSCTRAARVPGILLDHCMAVQEPADAAQPERGGAALDELAGAAQLRVRPDAPGPGAPPPGRLSSPAVVARVQIALAAEAEYGL